FLFLDLFHRRLGSFLVHAREAHLSAKPRAEGEYALLTFLDVERRLAEHEAHEFEARILGMALDRENALEGRLQPLRLTRVRGYKFLQKRRVRIKLRGQQVRHLQHACTLGETFTNTLFFGERVAHRGSSKVNADHN